MKIRHSLLAMTVLIFSFSGIVFAAGENAEDAEHAFVTKAFKDGMSYYSQNKLTQALYEFEAVLNAPLGSDYQDEALYWSGEIYLKKLDYKKALELYQRIAEEFPSSQYLGRALYSKGWCYYKLGLLDDAVSCFGEVVSRYPLEKSASEAQFRKAECEYLMAGYEAAGKDLEEFVEKFPVSEETAEAYYLTGEVKFYQLKYKDAIASFERALAISPAAGWANLAHYRMADALLRTGSYDASIKEFKKCLANRDNDLLAYASMMGLGRNYEKKGMAPEAMKIYDNIIASRQKGDTAAEAYYRKVKLLVLARRYDEAEKLIREAMDRLPDSKYTYDLHYELGGIYAAGIKYEDAVKQFRSITGGSKNRDLIANALISMGDIYLEAKDYSTAIENYDEVLDKYADNPRADYAQFRVGNIFLETKKFNEAVLAYQSVVTNFPDTALRQDVALALGAAYFRKGDFERAASELKNYLKAFPSSPQALQAKLYLADALYNTGKYPEALAIYGDVERDGSGELKAMAGYQAGWSYDGMGRDGQAAEEFTKFLKNYPSSEMAPDAMFWLAEYYGGKTRYDKAREYYYSIRKYFPSSGLAGKAAYQAALTFYEEGNIQEFTKRVEELAIDFPRSEPAANGYRKLARIKKDAGDFNGAANYLRKALGPENTELNAQIQYEIAESLESAGDAGRAAEEYLKVPYLYPKGAFWAVRARLKCAQLFEKTNRPAEAKKLYEKLAAMDVEESAAAKKRVELLKLQGQK